MKNRGKNKKKSWRRILPNIGLDLNNIAKEKQLNVAGFVVQKEHKINFVKGDKDAAKDHPEIPTATSFLERRPYRPAKHSMFSRRVDVWANQDENKSDIPSQTKSAQPNFICPAGQSYNPNMIDHRKLLCHVANEEMKAEGTSRKQTKKRVKLTQAQLEELHIKSKMKGKRPTAKQLAKQTRTDLENIPKLMKQIRKEGQKREALHQRRQLMKAASKLEKAPKFPISFQLPGELAPSLRRLRTDVHWMREVEFKRNKLPRARKTLDKKAKTTTFERRSRKY